MKVCAIIAGGEPAPLDGIEAAELVIACDRGLSYAQKNGITPDLIVGDFDSFKGTLPDGVPVIKLPCEKDETDTMAAVKYAIEQGFKKILLFCALGGRLDHTLGNLQTAAFAAKKGVCVKISDADNEIYVFAGEKLIFPARDGFSISGISLSDKSENVTVSGGRYELENAVLTNMSTLGISNEWAGTVTVGAERGVLAVIMSRL